jgi:DNA-binding HxlR family transcriptional regulator
MAEPVWPAKRDFVRPTVMPIACPVAASLGVLGRKWALPILRDVAFYEDVRFSDILRMNPGLTPRVLSHRLRDLREADLVRRMPGARPREFTYELTAKGEDTIPILTAFMDFAFRHLACDVFADGRARTVGKVLPGAQKELLGHLMDYVEQGKGGKRRGVR